jgi:hypothetical protein
LSGCGSAGKSRTADLKLGALDITLSGASHGSVKVERSVAAQVSGASKLTYSGMPQFTKRDTSGASTVEPA